MSKWPEPVESTEALLRVRERTSKDMGPIDSHYSYPGTFFCKEEALALEAVAEAARDVLAADQMWRVFEVSKPVAEAINALDAGRKGRS